MTEEAKDRLKRAKEAMVRSVILDAAENVFATHGYEDARMQTVAKAAGVSSATVYGTFEGKLDLFRAVHARRTSELIDAVRAHPDARAEPLPRLLGGIGAYAGYLMAHPTYLRMLGHEPIWSLGPGLSSDAQEDAAERGGSLVVRAFADGVTEGTFRDDDTPEMMASLMHAMHRVRLVAWLRDEGPAPADVLRAMQRELIHAFVSDAARDAALQRVG